MTDRSARPDGVRLAIVVQNLNYGGMERVIHSLARSLPSHGFEVHVVVLEFFGRFADGLSDVATMHQARQTSRMSVVHPRELASLLRSIAPDLVHSHGGIWFQSARAARMAGVPAVVHTDHGRQLPISRLDQTLDWLASRWTNVIVAVSDPLATLLRTHVVRSGSDLRVITNGIEVPPPVAAATRASIRRTLGLSPEARVIGSIGRLEPVKNYGLALRALAAMRGGTQGDDQPVLIVVGDGTAREDLRRLATELGVDTQVRFLGWRDDATELYAAFDLFTLTSRSEGTSISLLEAMSSGLPPVVTDVGGNRHVLGPDLRSLLVPDDDAPALAEAWNGILKNAPLRTQLGVRARQRVEDQFSIGKMVEDHVALYQGLLAAGAPRVPADSRLR